MTPHGPWLLLDVCLGGWGKQGLHEETNAELAELMASEGIDVQLARDGMCVPLFAREPP